MDLSNKVLIFVETIKKHTIMKTIKIYVVSTLTSSRNIQARSKKETIALFKADKNVFYTDSDKITIK